MERKIFLEKNRSKFSTNKPNKIWTELDTTTKTMQGSGLLGDFSLFDQYNAERDACDKFRLIFTINPICSNVLFNMKTEVIQNEGSEDVIVLDDNGIDPKDIKCADGSSANCIVNTTDVNLRQAIKDTEYSHPKNGGFVYHCGIDIFDNHMLRSDGFVHVNKISDKEDKNFADEEREVFNTIKDYMRDGEGLVVYNAVNPNKFADPNKRYEKLRLYGMDNTLTFKRAYLSKLKEKDGWVGFYNPSNINIKNSDKVDEFGNEVLVNTMLANNKPCEFIDLYPDRSLYSFIPKYNKYKDRIEKNWDYCITYPYAKDSAKVAEVCSGGGGAIRVDFVEGHNASSIPILMCRTAFKHTLKTNSRINIYYDGGTKYSVPITVVSVGNFDGSDKDRYFSIKISDIQKIYDSLITNMDEIEAYEEEQEENEGEAKKKAKPKKKGVFFYKKVSGGAECDYYFRKYKKITKKIDEENSRELLSDINKLAYGENIYGDRVAQLIFLDDIDISGLTDHLNRPVTELYLTVVKRNAGHDDWAAHDYSSSGVEFSHCFSVVTSGLDFGPYPEAQMDYNVRYLHNVDTENLGEVGKCFGEVFVDEDGPVAKPEVLEGGITIDKDIFYGNLVEFDPSNYTETEISPVMHRFNTLQRENATSVQVQYSKFMSDVYDLDKNGQSNGFNVKDEIFNKIKIDDSDTVIPGALRPEGYFYNPHTKIKVREESDVVTKVRAKSINFAAAERIGDSGRVYKIKVPTSYNFLKWDYIAFSTYLDSNVEWGKITEVDGNILTVEFEKPVELTRDGSTRLYRAFYAKEAAPLYAKFNRATQEYTWRRIVAPSEMTQDMELYDTTFSNGHFYLEKNVTFFMRRQDPFGDFGLSYGRFLKGEFRRNPMEYFNVDSSILDLSQIYNFYNNLNNICY